MWICPNCQEPNSCSGTKCPYCNIKSNKFQQKVFIVMDDWIKDKAKLLDKSLRKVKKDRWIDRIPDNYWYGLCDIEKNFLFKIQENMRKEKV